jgi:MSHA biogenesis protein MshP
MALFMRVRARRKSTGVAIITAIFLLLVVAGLGVAVVTLTTAQQSGSAQDMQGQRAYQAARAGIEWALYNAQRPVDPPTPGVSLACPASYSFQLPGATLAGFTVTVSCSAPSVALTTNQGDTTGNHILITSIACNQPDAAGTCINPVRGPDYVQRRITAQL